MIHILCRQKGSVFLKEEAFDKYPLSKKLSRFAGEAIRDYSMIGKDDGILIGLSGGKDSLLMSLALAILKKRSPVKFSLRACLIDQSGGLMQTDKTAAFMDELEIPLKIIKHPMYEIIKEREERSPCSLCANIRRGMLAAEALSLGFSTIALGHNKDDAAETVLMNLFFEGRFKCFHPHLYMSRTGIRVIRPLVYIEERRIAAEAKRLELPVCSSCCPYGDLSKRKAVKNTLMLLEKEAPELKSNILHALKSIQSNESWPSGMLKE